MINFEVTFRYQGQLLTAMIIRNNPAPDILSIKEPNNLRLPKIFTFKSRKLNGKPVLVEHPGLATSLRSALQKFARRYPNLATDKEATQAG